MFLVLAYIKFLFRSTNQHGVHSPFVYGLVTRCFYDRKQYPAYRELQDHRKALLGDRRMIKVSDFGAGSRVFKSEERKVSAIAKKAGISPKRSRLLNRLVRYLKVDRAIELGTSVGLGTAAMVSGNKVQVTTMEGCRETAEIAAEKFSTFGWHNIELKTGKFEEMLEGSGSYDLIYIDGNHQKEATLRYFEDLLPTVHNDSVMIFDDIHWSPQMEEAWEEIKQHSAVTVSIDTFQWGLVFFRREQEKEHFVIRV